MADARCQRPACRKVASALAVEFEVHGKATEVAFCRDHFADFDMDFALPSPLHLDGDISATLFEECRLFRVFFDHDAEVYAIVLKSVTTNLVFAMRTGYVGACSVFGVARAGLGLNPLTYELVNSLISGLDGSVVEAVIDGYNTEVKKYKCHLLIRKGQDVIRLNCRGSDAVGISFLARAPIRVNAAFLGWRRLAETTVS
jgi:bifunctional DNase/RNase